jgi:hypothetical protein
MTLRFQSSTVEVGFDFDLDLNRPFEDEKEDAYEEAEYVQDEVVEWMREAGAHNRVMSPWKNDFRSAGGRVEAQSNDGWYPGTMTENFQIFRRQRGEDIQSAGFVRVDYADGSRAGEIDALDRGWVAGHKAFSINVTNFGTQHNTLLGEVKEAVSTPFDGEIRTFTLPVEQRGLLSAPTVFAFSMVRPAVRANFIVELGSNEAGTMSVNFWNDKREVVDGQNIPVEAEDQRVNIATTGQPFIRNGFLELNFDGFKEPPTVKSVDTIPFSF